jgi:hypothetical protein
VKQEEKFNLQVNRSKSAQVRCFRAAANVEKAKIPLPNPSKLHGSTRLVVKTKHKNIKRMSRLKALYAP